MEFANENEVELSAPTGLSANPSSGVIRIEFRVPDSADEHSHEVWRRHGDTVDWYLHATTEGASFADSSVKPGQYYEYKVRTVAGESTSEFSESVVAYGVE